jgi:orotate phosphoribosyltransferase
MNWREEIKNYVTRRDDGGTGPRISVDVKGMISRPELLYAVTKEIGDLILKKHSQVRAIGSHGVGGSFLIGPVMLYVYNHWFDVNGFFVRLDSTENGERHVVDGRLEKGWHVLIIDTVIKTGASSLKAHEVLRSQGCTVDGIIVVADLSNGDNACTRAGIALEPLTTL